MLGDTEFRQNNYLGLRIGEAMQTSVLTFAIEKKKKM